jgi:UDP-glucuronate 4-epimerase
MKRVLITGGAGFIGSHVTERLLGDGWHVTALDNFDPFYDRTIKCRNIKPFRDNPGYSLIEADIRDDVRLRTVLTGEYDVIVHLAAKAGVRPSIKDPVAYQEVNVRGTQNLLELTRQWGIKQFVFASSSSVYGVNPKVPWREDDHVLLPISPYASTKVSGELLGHVYSHLYGIRFVALRFFTVYGPRQRPDLAIHKFAHLLREGKPLPVYGDGATRRDYTFVEDIVRGIRAAMDYSGTPYEVINLGNNRTVSLMEMIGVLEEVCGRKAVLDRQPDQPGDVPQTWADLTKAKALLGYLPQTDFKTGAKRFYDWFTAEASQPC